MPRSRHVSAYSTPGLRLIVTFLLKVSLPAHLLFRTTAHCLPTLDAHLGWGCYTVLTSLLLFLLHILHTHAQTLYHLHRAHSLGALPVPTTSGRWPGNLDLLREWIGIWKTGYPGDIAGRLMVQLGGVETYAVKMCWKNTVFTADPEIIREILTTDHANYIKGEGYPVTCIYSLISLTSRTCPHRHLPIRSRLGRIQYKWRSLALSQEHVTSLFHP